MDVDPSYVLEVLMIDISLTVSLCQSVEADHPPAGRGAGEDQQSGSRDNQRVEDHQGQSQ